MTPERVGLSPEQLAAVFPFHLLADGNLVVVQAGPSARRLFPDIVGKGLLECESWEGRGSVFSLTVPLAVIPQRSGHFVRRPGLDGGKAILIVEDNDSQAAALTRLLEGYGLATERESSTGEALERLNRGPAVQAVLLDATFPGTATQEFVTGVRGRLGAETPPLLFLAPVGGRARVSREALGSIEIVTKPVRARSLLDALERAVLGRGMPSPRTSGVFETPLLATRCPLRILMVEDNAVNRRVVSLLLKSLGYRADLAENGSGALSALAGGSYDVVLMDVQMPEMDGLEATRRLRKSLPGQRQPYVIAMTAGAFRQERERCLEAGMDAFLAKPIQKADLEGILEQAVAARGGDSQESPGMKVEEWHERIISALVGLARLLGRAGPDFAAGTVEVFLKETGSRLGDLEKAVERGDHRTCEIIAHSLKGSCQSLGIGDLAEVLLEIEIRARGRFAAGPVSGLVQRARQEFQKVRDYLESGVWKSGLAATAGSPEGGKSRG